MAMCPTYTFIDRANGRFNDAMDFKREYAALISAAWEIDKAYDQFLSDIDGPDDDYNPLTRLGLRSGPATMDELEERKKFIEKLVKVDPDNKFRKRFLRDIDDKSNLDEVALYI